MSFELFPNFLGRSLSVATFVAVSWASQVDGNQSFNFRTSQLGALIPNQPSASVTQGSFTIALAAGPVGAILRPQAQGLGIDSQGVPGAVDVGEKAGTDRFNILVGDPPILGTPESVTFSFNRSGFIRSLLMDGVKDETLEFFRLELPGGGVMSFFDFEVGLRLSAQGFSLAALTEPNVTLLVDGDDDLHGLNIPFQGGQTFTISYREFPFPPGYVQNDVANGARWEGVVVVPEPVAGLSCVVGALVLWAVGRGRRVAQSSNMPYLATS